MEEQNPQPFTRHGTAEQPIEVSADKILDAIAEGRDVDVEYGRIKGDLNIRNLAGKQDKNGKIPIRISINMGSRQITAKMHDEAF